MRMKCGKGVCHQRSCVSITLLSTSLIILSLIQMITNESIAKSQEYESNADLESINSQNNYIQKSPVKQNYEYLKGVVTKRANIRYLKNLLDALDNRLEKFHEGLLRDEGFRPKRAPECLSGLPAADCENNLMGLESLGQDYLRPGGRNPGR